jgi:hypothetical protein
MANMVDVEDVPEPPRSALRNAVNNRQRLPPLRQTASRGYIWLFLGGIGLALYLLFAGFGQPRDAGQGGATIAAYVIAFGVIAWGFVARKRRQELDALLGFPAGVYAIGSHLVDARKRELVVHNLLDQKPSIVHRYVNGGYRGTTLTWHGIAFRFGQEAMARSALTLIGEQLDRIAEAAKAEELEQLIALDPMVLGLSMIETEQQAAFKRGDRPKVRATNNRPMIAALAATAVLAPGVWFARNYLSVEAAFSHITTAYEADAWVENGGDAARGHRKKMEIELHNAALYDKDNAAQLHAILDRYPDAPAELKKPVQDALKARYETTRKAALALTKSEELAWFINKVYDRLEAGGATAQMMIKVARTDSTALAKLDEVVAKSKKLSATIVPVAKFFGTEDELSRADGLKAAVEKGVAKFFPEDVMKFDKDAKDAPQIEIFYAVSPTFDEDGVPSLYTRIDEHDKPIPGSPEYPGIQFELGATLTIPGIAEPQKMEFTAVPAPTITVSHDLDDQAAHDADVYHAMSASAFSDLEGKLVSALGGTVEPAATGAGSDADADDSCPELRTIMTKLDACKKLKSADRQKALDAMKAAMSDPDAAADPCNAIVAAGRKQLAAAGCP